MQLGILRQSEYHFVIGIKLHILLALSALPFIYLNWVTEFDQNIKPKQFMMITCQGIGIIGTKVCHSYRQ